MSHYLRGVEAHDVIDSQEREDRKQQTPTQTHRDIKHIRKPMQFLHVIRLFVSLAFLRYCTKTQNTNSTGKTCPPVVANRSYAQATPKAMDARKGVYDGQRTEEMVMLATGGNVDIM